MTDAPSPQVRLNPDGLTATLTEIFQAAGGSTEEAAVIAKNLVAANLAGHDSHGVVRTQRYCTWVETGNVFFGRSVSTIVDSDAFCLLDANLCLLYTSPSPRDRG